ncbi:MAG: SOS response-associated peptidase, partial [Caldilineaceae bacterium]|nr:SOS response-associated peptidase [Caldilineaceae bacterium]
MCGRFALRAPANALANLFDLPEEPVLVPRYNIAPTQPVGLVRLHSATATRTWALALWGLIPSWAKDPSMGARMINARSETVSEKPSFRAAFRRRRCLIPADGFYE